MLNILRKAMIRRGRFPHDDDDYDDEDKDDDGGGRTTFKLHVRYTIIFSFP
jgi:hypothetical protein